jgi:NAD(P)-dependent dehydrogenase (short-subunit alcohol dehydrogenase family)
MSLSNRVAFVTGAYRGIGKEIALALADEGATVVVCDINTDIEQTAAEIKKRGNNDALGLVVDVTQPEQVQTCVQQIIDKYGKINILVNDAGVVGKRCLLWESDDAVWRYTIEVNLFGTYNVTKSVIPHMLKSDWGRIINIASISGKQASITNSAYCASKHGVIGLTRTLAAELGVLGITNITVNAICPGVVNTEMLTGEGMILDELARLTGTDRQTSLEKHVLPMSIQKRLIGPQEIADMAVYLVSEKAKGITGQAINVCGGSVFY